MIEVPIKFLTPEQERFFYLTKRNTMFSGGFGNGKTTGVCMKINYLMSNFSNYKCVIARYEESKLRHTTMQTFYKVVNPALYDPQQGGNRADSLNKCKYINGSEVLFMNLKELDEGMVRGLEINSAFIDQAEEVAESMWLMLSARCGRWDRAVPSAALLAAHPNWPRLPNGGYVVPSYMMGGCNPDSELHWIYRRFHPKSEQYQVKYAKNHEMVEGATTAATINEELLQEMKDNDPAWVDRFVFGKWGIPGGQIHQVDDSSVLRVGETIDANFVETIISRGNLVRVLDHGDFAPTCCLWFSAYKGNYYCYREYYKPNALISEHRNNISALSGEERYIKSLIDPQCAKKTLQKYGSRWSHVDEYQDMQINAPPIYFDPADNNELATRNRISELLRLDTKCTHPVTGVSPAPRLYFIERSENYPSGCYYALSQLKAQKRKKLGTIDGRDIYSDDRDDNVDDHAYDPIRYYCADHAIGPSIPKPKPNPNSFMSIRKNFIEWRRQNGMVA